MKIEEQLRSAIREYTESIRPDGSTWGRIQAGMDARGSRASRSIVMAAATVAAIVGLVAVRLVADEPLGQVDLTNPGPAIETPGGTDPTMTPTAPPIDGRWLRLPAPPVDVSSIGSSSVWTGRELILWIGLYQRPETGAAYNPATKRWRSIASFDVGGAHSAAAVWTGSEMIVWGGSGGVDDPPSRDGAAYNPSTDRWRRIAQGPLQGDEGDIAVWTGSEMIVWGPRTNGAAAYEPRSDRWRTLPAAPLEPRQLATMAWTGTEMIVWGGGSGSVDGAAYNPTTNRWRSIPAAPIPSGFFRPAAWTGNELVVWGGQGQGGAYRSDGARFDPKTDRWTVMAPSPLSPRVSYPLVASAQWVFIWGGQGVWDETSDDPHNGRLNDGAVYDLRTDTWHPLPRAPLQRRTVDATAFIGDGVILWGGCCLSAEVGFSDGAIFVFSR